MYFVKINLSVNKYADSCFVQFLGLVNRVFEQRITQLFVHVLMLKSCILIPNKTNHIRSDHDLRSKKGIKS